ncbi:unknown [Firmicutes bacterium CAG:884]|nr:unknown [Firmicutes bacterium CAG:884]
MVILKDNLNVFNNGKIVFGINGDLLCFPFAL